MKTIALSALSSLVFLGAGCTTVKPNMQPRSVNMPAAVVSEADFVGGVMRNETAWQVYENKEAGVTFQYPVGFFTEAKKYGDQASGMRYRVEARPTTPENGVCDGLGDIDCDIAQWPVREAAFEKALLGETYTYFGHESITVAERARTINGVRFVVGAVQGMNGSCTLAYVRATPKAYASFEVNICDDSRLDVAAWFGSDVSETEQAKAQRIFEGKDLSESTRVKMEAMEKVIATLKME